MNKAYITPCINITKFADHIYITTASQTGYTAARSVQGQMMRMVNNGDRAGIYTVRLKNVIEFNK